MRNVLTLAEYQLRAIRRPLAFLLLAVGPLQLLLVLALLAVQFSPGRLNEGYSTPELLTTFSLSFLAPAACITAAALLNFAVTARQNGRSKSIYTLMTLPGPRGAVFAAGVLSGLLAICAVIAATALWNMLLYTPLCALDRFAVLAWDSKTAARFSVLGSTLQSWQAATPFLHNGLFLSMARAGWMRLLLPLTPLATLLFAAHLLAMVSCLQAMCMRQGLMRLAHGILLAVSVLLCLNALFRQLMLFSFGPVRQPNELLLLLVQLALAAAAWASALRSLARAENL